MRLRGSDRLFVLALLILVLLQVVPVLVDYCATPPGHQYTGFVAGGEDYFSYLAKMRLGFEGKWLYINRMTPEPTAPALIFVVYLLLGHVCRWLHLPLWLGFHLARWILYPGLLIMLWCLMARLHDQRVRFHAFMLAVCASSIGALLPGDQLPRVESSLMIHLYLAASLPHYLVDGITLLGFWLLALMWLDRPRWWIAGLGVLTLNLLALVHPYLLVIALGVPGGYFLAARREAFRQWAWFLAIATVGVLPLTGYMAVTLLGHGAYAEWRSQVVTHAPAAWVQAVWLGLSQPLGLLGLASGLRLPGRPGAFWLAWAALAYVLMNLNPLGNSVEFALLLSLPVGALAAFGWLTIKQWWPLRPVANVALLLACLPGFLLASAALALPLRGPRDPHSVFYLPAEYITGVGSLPVNSVVLGPPQTGNLLPALASVRVYVGHSTETFRFRGKLEQAERFYTGQMDTAEALRFLRQAGVTHVAEDRAVQHPVTRGWSQWPSGLNAYSFLHRTFRSDSLNLYRIDLFQ